MGYKRNLALIMSGRMISLLGTGVQAVAIPLLILDLTKSATMMGLVSFLTLIPLVLASMISGSVTDKNNKKHILIIADIVSGSTIGMMAILQMMGMLTIPLLIVFQVIASITSAFYGNASASIYPELFGKDKLEKVNAYKGSIDNFAMSISPIVGATVYGLLGIKYIFIVNAISFIICGIAEIFLVYNYEKKEKKQGEKESLLQEFSDVFSFLKGKKALLGLFAMIIITNFFDTPVATTIFPFLFKGKLGMPSTVYGFMQSALVGGMMVGNLVLATLLAKKNIKKVFRTCLITQYTFMLILSLVSLPFIMKLYPTNQILFPIILGAVIGTMGLFNAICNTMVITNIQKLVPREMMGRFFAVVMVIFEVSNPLGILLYGFLLDNVSTTLIFISTGVILLATIIVFFLTASEEAYNPDAKTEVKEETTPEVAV